MLTTHDPHGMPTRSKSIFSSCPCPQHNQDHNPHGMPTKGKSIFSSCPCPQHNQDHTQGCHKGQATAFDVSRAACTP
jgi:hypothetical protein